MACAPRPERSAAQRSQPDRQHGRQTGALERLPRQAHAQSVRPGIKQRWRHADLQTPTGQQQAALRQITFVVGRPPTTLARLGEQLPV